jgi:plasmid maintenance system antidote protein VapI
MDAKEFAFKVGVSEETIIDVMNCESSITTELAVAFERITKIPAHF